MNIAQILKRIDSMFNSTERLGHEKQWAELSKYLMPNFTNTMSNNSPLDTTAGQKKGREVFASEPVAIADTLASAFLSLVTNPAAVWSQLKEQRQELNDNPEYVQFLQASNNSIHKNLNQSNFYGEWGKFIKSYIVLGNAALLCEESTDDSYRNKGFEGFTFTALNMGQVAWSVNKKSIVDTLAWKFYPTARQAFEMWGDKVSDRVKTLLETDPDSKITIYKFIQPRNKSQVKLNDMGLADAKHRPFQCLYIDPKDQIILEETGYYEFPALIGRWEVTAGEDYGRGRGHIAIYDVRSYNKLREESLYAIAKDNRPPLLVNQRDVFGELPLRPGVQIPVRNINGVKELVSMARTDRIESEMQRLIASINSIFYIDKLLLPPRDTIGQMREVEVLQRAKEISTVFGPVGLRITNETLTPLILWSFKTLLRHNSAGTIPPTIMSNGLDVDVQFVSELAQAQQIKGIQNTQQWLQLILSLSQFKPEVLDFVEGDMIVKDAAKILNVPEQEITNDEEVAKIRQSRNEQQAQMAQAQQANLQADTASKMSKSNPTGGALPSG